VSKHAERLIGDWNERQARRMPLLLAPTMGAALAARYCFLGPPPGLPNHPSGRSARGRKPRGRGRDRPHPRAVVPFMPVSKVLSAWLQRAANVDRQAPPAAAATPDADRPLPLNALLGVASIVCRAGVGRLNQGPNLPNLCPHNPTGRFGLARMESEQTALSLDDNDADVHRVLAAVKLIFNEHDKAIIRTAL
jgi:hypothetical protein